MVTGTMNILLVCVGTGVLPVAFNQLNWKALKINYKTEYVRITKVDHPPYHLIKMYNLGYMAKILAILTFLITRKLRVKVWWRIDFMCDY